MQFLLRATSVGRRSDVCWMRGQVERGQEQLRSLTEDAGFAEGRVPWQAMMGDLMGDRCRVEDDSQLPDTGMPVELERALSSIFVEPFTHPVPPHPFCHSLFHPQSLEEEFHCASRDYSHAPFLSKGGKTHFPGNV